MLGPDSEDLDKVKPRGGGARGIDAGYLAPREFPKPWPSRTIRTTGQAKAPGLDAPEVVSRARCSLAVSSGHSCCIERAAGPGLWYTGV